MWDVWIHILGIRAECAWWGRAARVCRPYKRKGDLSLKTQRRNAVSQKVLLVPFLLRKGTAYFLF